MIRNKCSLYDYGSSTAQLLIYINFFYHSVGSKTEIHDCNVSISSNRLRLIELTFKVISRLLRFNLKNLINFNLLPKYQNSKAKTRVAVYNSWPKHDTRHGCEILNSFDVNFHSINLHNQLLK